MIQQTISLKILGTKQRQSGFNAIMVTGAVGLDKEFDRRPIISSTPAYIVKHTATNSLYQLIDCNVKSLGANTNGVLTIVIAIPAGTRMTDNRSPYSLLMEIYAHFRRNYMTMLDDGRYEFRDIDMNEHTQEFRDILDSYPLEEYPMPRTVMSGDRIGTLSVSPALIEDFFRDCNYPEMAVFKDVEVGLDCETSPELAMLEIPRREKFTVYINGEATPNIISSPNEPYTARKEATLDYLESSVTFTLSELMGCYPNPLSKDGNSVKIDMLNRRIDVNLTRKSKGASYSFVMQFSGTPWYSNQGGNNAINDFKQSIKDGKVKVYIGDIDITDMLQKKSGRLPNKLNNSNLQTIRMENNSGINCDISAELEGMSRIKIIFKAQSPKGASRRPGSTNIFPPTPKENTMTTPPSPTQQPSETPLWKKLIPIIVVALIGLAAGFFAGRFTAPRNTALSAEDTIVKKSDWADKEGFMERLQMRIHELENPAEQAQNATPEQLKENDSKPAAQQHKQQQQPSQQQQQPSQQQQQQPESEQNKNGTGTPSLDPNDKGSATRRTNNDGNPAYRNINRR